MKNLTRKQARARIEAAHTEARKVVATGTCPTCGAGLRRNLAMAGWWQCEQFGAPHFRARPNDPDCSFQTFTE